MSFTQRVRWMALLAVGFGLSAQEPLMRDDFDDGVIDPLLWQVSLPFVGKLGSTATETNGGIVLFRRAVLDAASTFEGGLDMQGKFRFTGMEDTLSIVFRSDLTATNQFERRGVQVALQQMTGRVFLIPEPFDSSPVVGEFSIRENKDVVFRITDDGALVRLYLNDLFTPLMSVAVTNNRGNRLCLYNAYGTSSRTVLDYFAVYPLGPAVFVDHTLRREGTVQKSTPVEVRLQSHYPNGAIYYTLDGSEPSFTSREYVEPFTLAESATLRSIAYRSDFLESAMAPTIHVLITPDVVLRDETPGGGTIRFDPPGPVYPSNTVVSLTATPAPGWQFLRWEGAASSTVPTNTVAMTNHLAVRAVFGTAPNLATIGPGLIQTYPTGTVHAFGTRLQVMAVPAAGNYFFRWANALSGNASPATLKVTNAAPAVTALFSALTGELRALTPLVEGAGTISLIPAVNVLTNGQSTILTARPDPDQVFIGWSGDAEGLANPLTLLMSGDRTLTARFAPGVKFETAASRLGTNGFSLSLTGLPGIPTELQASSDLGNWFLVTSLTNASDTLLYEDGGATNQPTRFYRVVAP